MGNLNLTPVAANQNSKEVTINDADAAIESALTDTLAVDFSGGNVTLTSPQYRGSLGFIGSGTSSARDFTLPAIERTVWIKNGNTGIMTVKRGSTSVTLAVGASAFFYTDGTTNGLEKLDLVSGGTITFLSLTDTPANYTSAGRKILRVNAAANAVEFVDMSYTLAFYQENIMTNAQMVYKFIATVAFTLPASLTGSYATSEVASVGNVHFDIKKNGTDNGDITFNTSSTGSFTYSSDVAFAAGDVLTIIGPATADANLAGVAVSLKGYLT